jgi:hypothetical protein
MMKIWVLAGALIIVAGISFQLGRRQGASGKAVPSDRPLLASAEAEPSLNAKTLRSTPRREDFEMNPGDASVPFAQNLTSAQRGFAAAAANLDDAIRQINSLPLAERLGFTTGVFSFVARNFSPAEALEVYRKFPVPNALRALVAEWVYTRSPLDEDRRSFERDRILTLSSSRVGLEVELASMLATTQVDSELATAFFEAFSNESNRSDVFLALSRRLTRENPDTLFSRTEGWTPWERERVMSRFLTDWAVDSPGDAWQWYQGNRGRFDQDFSSSILGPLALADPDRAMGILSSLDLPAERTAAIEAIGKALARKNTDQAVEWANGLPEGLEREAANRAIYDAAPRGIGAVLNMEAGFPTIRSIVPGSPLEGSGVQPGDWLLELRESNGAREPLYAVNLATAVNLIRGEPGSEITLRLLRKNKDSGQLEEHLVPVTRGQLYLNEKSIPNPVTPAPSGR